MGITSKVINIPIYNFKLKIFVSDDWNEFAEKLGIDNCDGLTQYFDYKYIEVYISGDNPGVIAHEVTHIKNMMWDIIGQTLDLQNDETEAYLVQYLFENIYNVYKKHKE